MKQSQHVSARVVAGCMALAFVVLAAPAIGQTNTIPFQDSFERYGNGAGIPPGLAPVLGDGAYWAAETNTYLVATQVNYTASSYPITYDHSTGNVARLATDGTTITSKVAEASSLTNVWLDMNIQMVRWQEAGYPSQATSDNEVQTSVFLGSNGLLNVYYSTLIDFTPTYGSNAWAELSHTAVETGAWHRLTITMDYLTAQNTYAYGFRFFQVQLDGQELSHVDAWPDPANPAVQSNGTWFLCANQPTINGHLSETLFSGTGYLDDFVVTDTEPVITSLATVSATVNPPTRGIVDPTDTTVQAGTNVSFTITPDAYWFITDITTNGVTTGETTSPYVWSNVPNGGTLVAELAPETVTNGVPKWWLDAEGYTNLDDADALDNSDGDMYAAWKEWLLSTDPTVSNSFKVMIENVGGSNKVSFVTDGEIDESLPDYDILKWTDLNGAAETNQLPRSAGSSEWTDPATGDAFYQFRVITP